MLGFYCATGFLRIKLKCLESAEGRRSVYGECSEGPRLGKKKKSKTRARGSLFWGEFCQKRGPEASLLSPMELGVS